MPPHGACASIPLLWRQLSVTRSNPDTAITHVRFYGDNTLDLQNNLAKLIMERARQVRKKAGNDRSMFGGEIINAAFNGFVLEAARLLTIFLF